MALKHTPVEALATPFPFARMYLVCRVGAAATVDLLVAYDDHSNNYFNGQVEAAMQNWVAQVNSIYAGSQVDLQLRLVGVMQRNLPGGSMGRFSVTAYWRSH